MTSHSARAGWTCALILALSCAGLLATSCAEDDDDQTVEDATSQDTTSPPFGSTEDVATAEGIWDEVTGEDFANTWSLMPGTQDPNPSNAPHTDWARIHINATAEADTTTFADGSILVKINLEDDQETVNAYTIMKKIDGFDSESQDWFFSKHAPDGALMLNPNGVPLAGAVGKGGAAGCVPCHSSEADLVFTN